MSYATNLANCVLRSIVQPLLYVQNNLRLLVLKAQTNLVTERRVSIYPLSHFRVGRNVYIAEGAVLSCGGAAWCGYRGGIRIGDDSFVGNNCVLLGGGEIEIGKKVLIAPGSVISTQGHFFDDLDRCIKDQATCLGKITIEDSVWIGANSTVLPGVRIGRHSVIGAGAVVNKDIPPCSLAVGVPAKVIRQRG